MAPFTPLPNGDQFVPSQRATFDAGTVPATVKLPAASRSLPRSARANTGPSNPLPSGDQFDPFQQAMLCVVTLPDTLNAPAAYVTPLVTASAAMESPTQDGICTQLRAP